MPLNNDYVCSTPEIPAYAPEPPAQNPGCECGCDGVPFYTPPNSGGGKATEVIAGTNTSVDNLSDINTYRFRVNVVSYTALSVNITSIIPYISGVNVLNNGSVLFGRTVDRVDLTWVYNKNAVISQEIASSIPGFVPPDLTDEQRTLSLTSLSVAVDRSFTITGDDGSGQPGGIQSDVEWVRFGNFLKWGKGAEKIGGNTSTLQALFNAMAGSLNKRDREHSFLATSGVNEYDYFFSPARFGEVSFKKGTLIGGFIRLKNVDGVLYETVPDGETEDEILISNGFGSENYYVYQSVYDNRNDPNEPIISF